MARIWIPLPDRDFDVTEVAVPWRLLTRARTYPAYVEDEVVSRLSDPAVQFVRGPRTLTRRGTLDDDTGAFVVEDRNYVSARWPGDAYLFTRRLEARIAAREVARREPRAGGTS